MLQHTCTFLNLWNLSDTFGAIASYAKVWVAHLFKLMDLDSLPEHCAGDGLLGFVRKVSLLRLGAHGMTHSFVQIVQYSNTDRYDEYVYMIYMYK